MYAYGWQTAGCFAQIATLREAGEQPYRLARLDMDPSLKPEIETITTRDSGKSEVGLDLVLYITESPWVLLVYTARRGRVAKHAERKIRAG